MNPSSLNVCRAVARLVVALALSYSAAAEEAGPCQALTPRTQAAIRELFRLHYSYAFPDYVVDGLSPEAPSFQLFSEGPAAVPCLLLLYQQGPAGTALWKSDAPPPRTAEWVLQFLRKLDPTAAIALYRAKIETLANPEDVWVHAEIVRLLVVQNRHRQAAPEVPHLERLYDFLGTLVAKAPQLTDRERGLASEALDAISAANWTPALGMLRALHEAGEKDEGRLPVYIAQLAGDLRALREFSHHPFLYLTAFKSFRRMGQLGVLEDIGQDRDHPFHCQVQWFLD